MEPPDFEAVYQQYAALVYRYLRGLGCPPQDAEDLTQDTFVKALLHMEGYRGDCKLSVWLCQIAKNTWLTQVKKDRRQVPPPSKEPAAPDHCLCEWLDLLDRLEEPYRAVFLDRALGCRSCGELARQYGKSESWVRVTYYRAKLQLRNMLEERRPSHGEHL